MKSIRSAICITLSQTKKESSARYPRTGRTLFLILKKMTLTKMKAFFNK